MEQFGSKLCSKIIIETLNVQQLSAFHKIIHAVYASNKQKYLKKELT